MPTLNSGVQTSLSVLSTEQMPDNDKLLYLYYRHQFPLFQKMYFSQGRASKPVVNSAGLFSWFEDELYPISTSVTADISPGTYTYNIESYLTTNFFQPNDILLVEATLQLVYVYTITTHTTINTLDDSTTITDIPSGTFLRKVGVLDHEFAGARAAVATKPVKNSNYLTKFSESVAFSGRQDAGESYTDGVDFKSQVLKKTWEMKEFYENNFTFSTESGTKTISATSSGYTQNFRATYGKGALGQITTNVVGYTTPNEDYWDSLFATLFNTGGSRHKTLYFGTNLGNNLAKIVKQKYAIDPKGVVTEYGVNLMRWTAFAGTVDLTWDVIMDNQFTDWGIIIDHEGTGKGDPVTFRYMKDDSNGSRKFRIVKHVETPGTDGRIDKLMADIGIMFPNEIINGVSKPLNQ